MNWIPLTLVADSAASVSQDDRPSAFLQTLFRRVTFEKILSHRCKKVQSLYKQMQIYLVLFNIFFQFVLHHYRIFQAE